MEREGEEKTGAGLQYMWRMKKDFPLLGGLEKVFLSKKFAEKYFQNGVDKQGMLVYNLLIESAVQRKLIVQNNERGD